MKHFLMVCTALVVLALVSCSEKNNVTTGSIVGTIISSRTNEPLAGVTVSLLTGSGKSITTSLDGTYRFNDLPAGDYTVQIQKENFKTDKKQVFVTAGQDNRLDFVMQPSSGSLELSHLQLDYGADATNRSITIKNIGQAIFSWQVNEDADWIECIPSAGSIPAGETRSVNIVVSRAGKAKGQYNQTISFTSDAGSSDVYVSMTVAGLKDVIVEPDELDFGSTTTSQIISMKNTGSSTVGFAVATSNDWILVSKSSGSFATNDYITVSVNRTQLAEGNYEGFVTIKVADQTQDIPVRMNIPAKSIPTVAIYETDNISETSAHLRGGVVSIGSSKIMQHGFCWDTNPEPDIEKSKKCNFGDCSTAKEMSYSVSSLTPGTIYHVRAYAINSAGVAYSNEETFMTANAPQKPEVETGSVTNIGSDHAQAIGNLLSTGNADGVTQHGHVWGLSSNPTVNNYKSELGAATEIGTFTSNLTALQPGKKYYVRAYATNSVGTAYGEEVTFTTQTGDVVLTTVPATDITHNEATVGGRITDLGGNQISERGVCWNTNVNPTINDTHKSVSDESNNFTVRISNLTEQTTYHARAYVKTSDDKVFYGSDVVFTTINVVHQASVSKTTVSSVGTSAAILSATINNNGGGNITDAGFCYSTTSQPTVADNKQSLGKQSGTFSTTISGLTESTTYYVRAYAVNEAGVSYGEETSFATKAKTEDQSNVGRDEFESDENWN